MDNVRDFAMGTCDGTGAVINVSLGFIPSAVEVLNIDSATLEEIKWNNQMPFAAQNITEGIMATGTSTFTRAAVDADGISEYAGGDEIIYDEVDSQWEDAAGTVKEEVYVNGHYLQEADADANYQCIGDHVEPQKKTGTKIKTTPGFIIGANTNLNVDGEQLVWRVWK